MKSSNVIRRNRKIIKATFMVSFSMAWLMLIVFGLPINPNSNNWFNDKPFSTTKSNVSATSLSEKDKSIFAPNQILFYNPGACVEKRSGTSYCGKTAKEKYWSAFSQKFDAVHVAAIFGNIFDEGGNISPTEWEIVSEKGYRGGLDWDELYNHCGGVGCRVGVGIVQITSYLSEYLQYINSRDSSLIKYFEDPTYDVDGDKLIEMIGESEFEKLMKLELDFIFKEIGLESDAPNEKDGTFHLDDFLNKTTVEDAASYWASKYERCSTCQTEETLRERGSLAGKIYEEMIDFVCLGQSSNTSSSSTFSPSADTKDSAISGNDITWIGDSYSVGARSQIQSKYPGVDLGTENPENKNSPYSYIQVGKHLDWLSNEDNTDTEGGKSGLDILKDIINNNALRPYLVLALGTNDEVGKEATIKTLEEINNLVKEKGTQVVILTAKTADGTDYTADNEAKKEFVASHDNFYLADWTTAYKDEYYTTDKIHPSSQGGYDAWLEIIDKALSSIDNGGCTKTYQTVEDYPQYFQTDYQDYYPCAEKNQTISACGCGPSSLAMLISAATGKEVTPPEIAALTIKNSYATNGIDRVKVTTEVCEQYGCEAKQINSTTEDIRKALKDGWMIHLSGTGPKSNSWDSDPFAGGSHFIGIFSVDVNDDVIIADSAGEKNGRRNRRMSLVEATNNRHSTVMAIRGKNYGKSCSEDANYCSTKNSNSMSTAIGEAATIELSERMSWLFPNGVPTTEEAMGQYLETIEVPIIDENGSETTMRLTVHKKLANEIKAIFQEMQNVKSFRIIAPQAGCFNWRTMRSGTNMSAHAYGAAIDLNTEVNPYGEKRNENLRGSPYYITDEIVNIWKRHGFYWGGDWNNPVDYMHFTYTNH